jgi:hypothetical protein
MNKNNFGYYAATYGYKLLSFLKSWLFNPFIAGIFMGLGHYFAYRIINLLRNNQQ